MFCVLCENEQTQVSLASSSKAVLKSLKGIFSFFFSICVQFVSASLPCMHLSGFVSYDCKDESSKHQLKYFIFTNQTVVIIYTFIWRNELENQTNPVGWKSIFLDLVIILFSCNWVLYVIRSYSSQKILHINTLSGISEKAIWGAVKYQY